ncbi:hypothetical protein [Acidovorax sp. sic0104]|uniref:hypothetical protein n=1 Tax=Acidovorax sp. sic0104 TaxID=2854784 RepID=UPI001C45937E|nr:hypothetical protein [Acidovorax sp. sic0104]MBV7541033.1 hypothetical protein [Acidovorax sp. sic0104]
MAKKPQDSPATTDKAKVRIFFAEIEGSNDSVREAVKSMVQAINRPATSNSRLPTKGANEGLPAPSLADTEEDEIVEVEEVEPEPDEQAPAPRKRGSGPKRDYNAGIDFDTSLDFRPGGKPTLREFFAEKGPKGDMEQILVVVYYMQVNMSMPAIGLSAVRTALKDVGKPLPADLRSTVRNCRKQKGWLGGSTPDSLQVTTVGENYVEHDMAARKG